ncbi:MAG: zinc-dependent metalloprotease [Betaproteobacteria bacterium]
MKHFVILAGVCAFAGCATLPDAPAVNGTRATAPAAATPVGASTGVPSAQAIASANRLAGAPGSTPAPPATPPALRSFADVSRDAKEMPGLFRLWQKDDKVWLEIEPGQFDQPFFFSTNLDQGLGETGFLAGSMSSSLSRRFGGPFIVAFRKVGTNVQMIAKNVKYTAQAGSPEARAVTDGFSDSLLASAAIASQPHPERKSILVEANALLVSDLPGAATRLEQAYRQSYAFDARNSFFGPVHSAPAFVSFNVTAHYALSRVASPAAGQAFPQALSTVPDVRSLFLGFHYSLSKLPEVPMRPRKADNRIGYFGTTRWDFTTDDRRIPIIHYANRWRLEKRDPAAALSEPREPIVFWIDRNVPQKYRGAIRDGVLEWNKAFARIGFKDAVRAEIQPDDADFNTSDIRHASIRWIASAKNSFVAIGPSVVDPRTGEILDADIGIDGASIRAIRSSGAETIPMRPSSSALGDGPGSEQPYCTYDRDSAEHEGFAMSLLEARGDMMLDGPEAEAFIQSRIKSTVMHEVGHTLGLTHNFRASTVYTDTQLTDPAFTRANGIAGSVMEYNAVNLALPGEKQGEFHMSTLGPYDYWAIEYGYREIAPEQETAELTRIAERSSEPTLAFMADDSLFYSGLDPQANTFDLGTDPLIFADRQLKLARELWSLTESRMLRPDESYALLRRNFSRGLFEVQAGANYAVKYIGGLTLRSDHAGSGRAPLEPVAVEKQRVALVLLAKTVFAADSFRFPPSFLRRLAVSDADIDDARDLGRTAPTVDIAVDQQILAVHRAVLGPLLGPDVAQRLLNNELKAANPKEALRLAELYATLHAAIFSELKTSDDIPLIRRNLQRDYIVKVSGVLIRPNSTMPADARALLRADAIQLRDELAAVRRKPNASVETRAHVAESLATLDDALKATSVRQGL